MTNEPIDKWLVKAEADLETVRILLDIKTTNNEIICFHCQQAVEKLLKAYLVHLNEKIPKTHDLDTLLKICISKDSIFVELDRLSISILTDCAVDFRYLGDDFFDLPREEIHKYYALANDVRKIVLEKVSNLL